MKETFGQKMQKWRERAGVSQAELARRMHVSRNYVSNLERDFSPTAKGGKPQPSVDTCDKIARALSVPVAEVRLAAGYAPQSAHVETVEEALDTAAYFDHKGLNESDRATLRPLLEVADREVERLTSQHTHAKPTRTPSAKIQSPTRKGDKIDELIDSALLYGGGRLSEKDRERIRKIYEERQNKDSQ